MRTWIGPAASASVTASAAASPRRRREGEEEGVSLRVHLDAVVAGESLAQHPPVLGERLRVRLGPSSCRSFVEPSTSVKRKVTVPVGSARLPTRATPEGPRQTSGPSFDLREETDQRPVGHKPRVVRERRIDGERAGHDRMSVRTCVSLDVQRMHEGVCSSSRVVRGPGVLDRQRDEDGCSVDDVRRVPPSTVRDHHDRRPVVADGNDVPGEEGSRRICTCLAGCHQTPEKEREHGCQRPPTRSS